MKMKRNTYRKHILETTRTDKRGNSGRKELGDDKKITVHAYIELRKLKKISPTNYLMEKKKGGEIQNLIELLFNSANKVGYEVVKTMLEKL